MKNRAAFTFTETLVIASIGFLLIGLLLPSLEDAKQKLQAAQCLSNMRQWGLAFGMYCNDNQDYMPYTGMTGDIGSGFNLGAWFNVLPHYINQPPLKDLYATNQVPVPGSRSVFVCPSARPIDYTPTTSKAYHSYAMNRELQGVLPSPPGKGLYERSIAALPGQVILFSESENNEFPFTDGFFIGSGNLAINPNQAAPRHSGGRNFVFVDGHAQWYTLDDYSRTKDETGNGTGSLIEWTHEPPYTIYWWPCRTCRKQ
jgi:prepilin-type processing-associated H-X9-DG protein